MQIGSPGILTNRSTATTLAEDAISRIHRHSLQQDELCYRLLQEGRSLKDQVDTLRKKMATQDFGSPREVENDRATSSAVIQRQFSKQEKTSIGKNFGRFIAKFTRTSNNSLEDSGRESTNQSSEPVSVRVKLGLQAPDMAEGALNLRKKKKPPSGPYEARFRSATASIDIFEAEHPFRGIVRRWAERRAFSVIVSSFIILSALLIGVEIECEAQSIVHGAHDAESWWSVCTYDTSFKVMQVIVGLVFIIEVMVRLVAYDVRFFGYGVGQVAKDWQWNVFDLVCLIATCVDLFFMIFVWREGAIVVNLIRQFRIVRVATTIRTARFAREFRKMSYALQYSGSTLLWAIVTIVFVIFFFAAAFTQATTEHLRTKTSSDDYLEQLEESYGTLSMSMHSLFQAVSGGIDWYLIIDPLMNMSWVFPALFLFYIAATTFGVMNVVTSVFVESAVASYHHYKEVLIQENIATRKLYVHHLQEIFDEIDVDNDGEISIDELERFLTDPFLQQYLESIDVHPSDATTLFKLLDKDASGFISMKEFCNGCLRLKGEAKSYDIHCMIYENERIMHKFQDLITFMENGLLARVDQTVRKSMAPGHLLSGGVLASSDRLELSGHDHHDLLLESLKGSFDARCASTESSMSEVPPLRGNLMSQESLNVSTHGGSPSEPIIESSRVGKARKDDRQKPLTPRDASSSNFTPPGDSNWKGHQTPLPTVGRDFPAFFGTGEHGLV